MGHLLQTPLSGAGVLLKVESPRFMNYVHFLNPWQNFTFLICKMEIIIAVSPDGGRVSDISVEGSILVMTTALPVLSPFCAGAAKS